ncbi:MAG: ferrochelatase [Actinomycetota bacterium]
MTKPIGVLVMAYGTPGAPEEIEPYYTRIRHGHPPTPELLDDLIRRYDAIGGISPLAKLTRDQVDGIEAALEVESPGGYLVRFGAKYTEPSIEAAAAELAASCDVVVGLVLTPHQASLGSMQYHERAALAFAETSVSYIAIPSWYDLPAFAVLQGHRLNAALAKLTPQQRENVHVLFTAHSLPEKILETGDPYPDQVKESGALIAAAAGVNTWSVAWQSAGRTRDPWIGPSILDELPRLQEAGATAVIASAVGFVSDHLEVLFDLDVEAQKVADELGLAFGRTESLNADPEFIAVLVSAIVRAMSDD